MDSPRRMDYTPQRTVSSGTADPGGAGTVSQKI